MKYDSILFDLDGTLWNSTKEVYLSWVETLKKLPDISQIPTMKQVEGVMGMTDLDLMKTLFPQLSNTRALEIFNLCCQEENAYLLRHGATLYPGVRETLQALSRTHKLAVVSNCNEGYIECFMESMKTEEFFSDFESFGRTRKEKWENIRLVIQRNGWQDPVYVGDTHWDKEAAEKAGIPFIHAAYGFGKLEGDFPKISQISQLINLVSQEDERISL